MARSREEKKAVRYLLLAFVAATLLTGCEAVKETLVHEWFVDHHMSVELSSAIHDGLERKMAQPAPQAPRVVAPPFLDQG